MDEHGWIDLGGGHRVKFTSWSPDRIINLQYEGMPDVEKWGLVDEHRDARDPSRMCSGAVTFDGETQRLLVPERARWDVVSLDEETLHIEPSLLCTRCGDHGFIRGGRWVPA